MNKIHIVIITFLIFITYMNNNSSPEILLLLVIPFTLAILIVPSMEVFNADTDTLEEINPIDAMLDDPTFNRQDNSLETLQVKTKHSPEPKMKSSNSKGTSYFGNLKKNITLKYFIKKSRSKLCFIGVGGGGSNILSDLSKLDFKHTYIHINSDNNALLQKQSGYKILLTSEAKNNKWGCGGNIECGLSLIDQSVKDRVEEFTQNYETVYLIATLGGGVGSGSTPEIAKYLQEINKEVVTYTTLPFTFEGKARLETASKSLKEIEVYSDDSIVLDNNYILKSNKGLRESFSIISMDIYKKIVATK